MLSDYQRFKITKDTAEDISRQPRKIQNIVSQERLFFLHNAMVSMSKYVYITNLYTYVLYIESHFYTIFIYYYCKKNIQKLFFFLRFV